MTDDVLTRARAVVARIRATREAGYGAAPGEWDSALAPSIELDATPALIALADAVGREREAAGALRHLERDVTKVGGVRFEDLARWEDRARDANGAIDAALDKLAALDGAP